MKILCLLHSDFETPGLIKAWAKEKGHDFTICKPYKGEENDLILTTNFDFLLILGGPQCVMKLEEFPYLKNEMNIIKDFVLQNKMVIGFCLGTQLIGAALDAPAEKSPEKELGIFPITLNEEGLNDPLLQNFPPSFPAVHWHYDMSGIPANSVILATSEGCPRQIIRYTPKTYGFQCHFEITKIGIKEMIRSFPEDLHPSHFTQKSEDFLNQDFDEINQFLFKILDRMVELFQPMEKSIPHENEARTKRA